MLLLNWLFRGDFFSVHSTWFGRRQHLVYFSLLLFLGYSRRREHSWMCSSGREEILLFRPPLNLLLFFLFCVSKKASPQGKIVLWIHLPEVWFLNFFLCRSATFLFTYVNCYHIGFEIWGLNWIGRESNGSCRHCDLRLLVSSSEFKPSWNSWIGTTTTARFGWSG